MKSDQKHLTCKVSSLYGVKHSFDLEYHIGCGVKHSFDLEHHIDCSKFFYVNLKMKFNQTINSISRASDLFKDLWAKVTHGAKNGWSFSEMMGPSISN